MTDSIIILAGGKSKRWGGEVKYLKEVCGEPVLHRTQRLVAHFRPDADVHTIGTELQRDNPNEVFALLKDKWSTDGMTYLILGDVSWMKGTLGPQAKRDELVELLEERGITPEQICRPALWHTG